MADGGLAPACDCWHRIDAIMHSCVRYEAECMYKMKVVKIIILESEYEIRTDVMDQIS